jgi:hypothetical protein
VVASGVLLEIPREQPEDPTSLPFWKVPLAAKPELRVRIRLTQVCTSPRAVVRADWLKNNDPVLSSLPIFRFRSQTNYRLSVAQAKRLQDLVVNTGKDWSEEEALAGLYAYVKISGGAVSKKPDSTVAQIALTIGGLLRPYITRR